MESSPANVAQRLAEQEHGGSRGRPRYRLHRRELRRHQLPSPVMRLADALDGCDSVERACARAGVAVARGRAAVRKLVSLGIVSEPASEPVFTELEESFFASELPVEYEPAPTLGARLRALLARKG